MNPDSNVVSFRKRGWKGGITATERSEFLAFLQKGESVQSAATLVGRDRQRFYELRERDKDFAEQWSRAEHPLIVCRSKKEPNRLADMLGAAGEQKTRGVYFITGGKWRRDGVPIKIGWGDAKARLAGLQIGNPSELRVVLFLPGTPRAFESSLHEMFAIDHIRGEWFSSSPKLRATIEDLETRHRSGGVSAGVTTPPSPEVLQREEAA